MVLLRRVIGDALRARRQGQHRTLREVSTAANVSLGYLSEIERGQKEASSELLAAICEALGARLSEVLGEVSDTLALAESMEGVLAPVEEAPVKARLRRRRLGVRPPGVAAQDHVAHHAYAQHRLRSLRSVRTGRRRPFGYRRVASEPGGTHSRVAGR